MATDIMYFTQAALAAAGVIRAGEPNNAGSANALISADGTQVFALDNNGNIVGATGLPTTVTTLTDAATITWAWSNPIENVAQVTLGGSRTLAITGATVGERGTLKVVQDGTGSRVITWPTTTIKPATPLTTTAGAIDLIELVCVQASPQVFWMVTDTKNVS